MASISMEDVGNYLSQRESGCRQKAAEASAKNKPIVELAYTAAAEAYADAIGVLSLAIDH